MFSLLAQNYLTRGFWGDEAWTSLISQLPYLQMLKTTAADFHPPAYYTIVELIYKFLPPTEIVTRSISIFFFLLTVYLVYKLAKYLKGTPFGLLCAGMVFLNPIFFTYAFEARNYTMFAFAATGSMYFLTKLLAEFTRKRAILFILFSTLGIYTHYYMFFILAAQGLYVLLWDRRFLFKMMGAYAICGILYLPWIPFFWGQLTSVGQSYWIGGIDARTHFEALLRILGGETKNNYRPYLFWTSVILLVVGIGQHVWQRKFEKPYLLIWLWAIVPFVLATLPGLKIDGFKLPFRPIFFWRYLIGSAVPLSMVIVHSAQKLQKYLFVTFISVVIALSVAIDFLVFGQYPFGFKQVYQQKIVENINPEDKIVTVLPSFAEVMYYRNRNNLENDLVVLPEGLVQYSGKSLLDAYAENGKVVIENAPASGYFELRPGPNVQRTK